MLNFYDFEVFAHDWLVVIINPEMQKETIIHNDRDALIRYYELHKNEIWCGYNSRNYDSTILKSILLNFDVKYVSDCIVQQGMRAWQIDRKFRKIQLYDYDAYILNTGLKQLEGFMGSDIKETSVPFDLPRPLTERELAETVKYCRHDVEQLIEVFLKTKSDFDAHMDMIKTFHLPMYCISKTKIQIAATVLGCKKAERFDEWDLQFVPTLKLDKYRHIQDWFNNPVNHDYKKSLEVEVCGVPHSFGWGGLHGAPKGAIHRKGLILHVDVTSYYPSIMIRYNFFTRNCSNPAKFKEIYDKRVALKKAGKKAAQAPFKIILNGSFGMSKDPNNPAFDPQMANNVCVNGQLMLLDLLEHLEGHVELIQSNTDGLIIQIPDTDEAFNLVDDICYEWEQRTGMGLGFDFVDEIWQGDVNNYVFRFDNGKLERKGGYVKELGDLDYDLPIVNKAIVDRLTNGTPAYDTVMACDDLKMFQKIVKISGKYRFGWHNGHELNEKTFRVFASKSPYDSFIGKCKEHGATIEKFANTPERCFIDNGDVNGKKIDAILDRLWYVELAEKRLYEKFGVDDNGLIQGIC